MALTGSAQPERRSLSAHVDRLAGAHRATWPRATACGAAYVVVTLALVLRLAAALALPSLGRDEANDVFVSREAATVGALLETLRVEGSPPLRFLLVERPLHRAFPWSVWPVRLAQILLGTLAVAVVIAVGRLAFGNAAGIAAGLLMAIAPYFIRASIDLRSQSLYQLLAAAYALAMVRLLDAPAVRGALVAGLLGGLLMLTHYYGLFIVSATVLFGIAVPGGAARGRRAVALAGAAAVGVFLPWLPFLVSQLRNPLRPDVMPRHGLLVPVEVITLPLGQLGVVLVPACLAAWAWLRERGTPGIIQRGNEDARLTDRSVGLFLAGALGANLIAWMAQWIGLLRAPVHPRYLVGPAVWLVPLLGVAVAGIVARAPRPLAAGMAGLIALSQALAAPGALRPATSAPLVARAIEAHGQPGDLILITHASMISTFNFYYRGNLEQWAVPFRGRITHVPWAEVSARIEDSRLVETFERELAERLDGGRRVWLVWSKELPPGPDVAWSPPPRREAYNRFLHARNDTHRRLLRVLYAHGRPILDYDVPSGRYREPLGAVLFLPQGRRVGRRPVLGSAIHAARRLLGGVPDVGPRELGPGRPPDMPLAEGMARLTNGGQRRLGEIGVLDAVESDDRKIATLQRRADHCDPA